MINTLQEKMARENERYCMYFFQIIDKHLGKQPISGTENQKRYHERERIAIMAT